MAANPITQPIFATRFAFHQIVPVSESAKCLGPWHEALMRPPDTRGKAIGDYVETLYMNEPPHWIDGHVVRAVSGAQHANAGEMARVSINIHPASLLNDEFVDEVLQSVIANRLRGCEVCLELIEYGDCLDRGALIRNAKYLRAAGALIALDDFGRRLNCFDLCGAGIVDYIKIDMGITRDVDKNPHQVAVIKSIVALAEGLGGEAIAEGVETKAQLKKISEIGVHYAQGYLIGKPKNRIGKS